MNKDDVNPRIIRWLFLFQQFDLIIVDRPWKENVVAYFLALITFPIENDEMIYHQFLDEHLFSISLLSPCFFDITNFVVVGRFRPNLSSKEKRKIVIKCSSFTWIGGNVFKLEPNHIPRTCVWEDDIFDILSESHDGPCGGHFSAKMKTFKILQVGQYWPNIHQDAKRYTNRCDECQREGNPTLEDEIFLQAQVTLEPFEKWSMDFIQPIDPHMHKIDISFTNLLFYKMG